MRGVRSASSVTDTETLPELAEAAPELVPAFVVGAVVGVVASFWSARSNHPDDPDWASRADWWQWGGVGAVLGVGAWISLLVLA